MKKERIFVYIGLCITILLTWAIAGYRTRPDGNMHVVFCSVGQGDAIYVKLPDGKDILIDGGPNNDVLNCIGKHMAFWDRSIELVLLTHPQFDHYNGLIEVVKRYDIGLLFIPPAMNEAESFHTLLSLIREHTIAHMNVYAGDAFHLAGSRGESEAVLEIVSPQYAWTNDHIDTSTTHKGVIQRKVLAATTTHDDLNDFSIVSRLHFGEFDVLLTGDAEYEILEQVIKAGDIPEAGIEVFKVGHHGATAGLSSYVAKYIDPDVAIISVGAGNRYGHPRAEILHMLDAEEIPYKRTDRDGDIHIVSDGASWWFGP